MKFCFLSTFYQIFRANEATCTRGNPVTAAFAVLTIDLG